MPEWKIPLFRIHNTPKDAEAVARIVRQGRDWALGSEIKEFEQAVAGYVGVKYAVACNSGTSALHIAMLAHEIGENHIVVVPSFTFIATCNAPQFVGAEPRFADIDEQTYGLSWETVKPQLWAKAVIAVHYAGMPCDVESIRGKTEKYGVIVIEDAAEAFGSEYRGKKVGSLGHSSILSFCSAKVLTTGEGGMFLTNDKDAYEKAKLVVSHGRAETESYFDSNQLMEYVTLGYNWRMSTMTAALGLSQLKRIDTIIEMRQEKAEYMTKALSGIDEIQTPVVPKGATHVYMLYTIRAKHRDSLKDYLASKGICSRVYFPPVHLSLFYRQKYGYKEGLLPVTERLSKEVLTLPMWPEIRYVDMDEIATRIKEFYGRK